MVFNPADMPLDALRTHRLWGHAGRLGIRYHGHNEAWIEFALPYAADLVGNEDSGVIASGPIIATMDIATSMAVWSRLGRFVPHATMDLRIDYLRPARVGRTVIGRAECLRIARSIAFTRGIAYDEEAGDPIAHVAATFMVPSGSYRDTAAEAGT